VCFSRQVWFFLFQRFGVHDLLPQTTVLDLRSWWMNISTMVAKEVKREFNSLAILGSWLIWNHRNNCIFKHEVFYSAQYDPAVVLSVFTMGEMVISSKYIICPPPALAI
jgi:hypothetical protein